MMPLFTHEEAAAKRESDFSKQGAVWDLNSGICVDY